MSPQSSYRLGHMLGNFWVRILEAISDICGGTVDPSPVAVFGASSPSEELTVLQANAIAFVTRTATNGVISFLRFAV